MGSWDYRVVRTVGKIRTYLAIHEVFLDDNGKIWGVTDDPTEVSADESFVKADGSNHPMGEGVPELKTALKWMLEACDKPVLNAADIPEEGAVAWDISDEDFDAAFEDDTDDLLDSPGDDE